jgi:hypothetical protein
MPPTLLIDYGIEELFIDDAGGDISFDGGAAVEVRIDRFGNAEPRYLVVDGEKLDLEQR